MTWVWMMRIRSFHQVIELCSLLRKKKRCGRMQTELIILVRTTLMKRKKLILVLLPMKHPLKELKDA